MCRLTGACVHTKMSALYAAVWSSCLISLLHIWRQCISAWVCVFVFACASVCVFSRVCMRWSICCMQPILRATYARIRLCSFAGMKLHTRVFSRSACVRNVQRTLILMRVYCAAHGGGSRVVCVQIIKSTLCHTLNYWQLMCVWCVTDYKCKPVTYWKPQTETKPNNHRVS